MGTFTVGHGEVTEGSKVSVNPTVGAVKYPTLVHKEIISGRRRGRSTKGKACPATRQMAPQPRRQIASIFRCPTLFASLLPRLSSPYPCPSTLLINSIGRIGLQNVQLNVYTYDISTPDVCFQQLVIICQISRQIKTVERGQ